MIKTEQKSFWNKLKRPIYALAPMADVTDAAFRRLIASHGKPDILFTEFVSCDGLCSRGYERLSHYLAYDNSERPIVAQVFGENPKTHYTAARIIADLGFDGIDINMGCPVRTILKQKAGAYLIKTPELAQEIIYETMRGAGGLPVSVKTRIGFNQVVIDQWLPTLLETKPAGITLHLRTAKELSKVPAHWEIAKEAADLSRGSGVPVLGNGDVMSLQQADDLIEQSGLDGIMFGRAIFGNPWLFNRGLPPDSITVDRRLDFMIEHARLYEKLFTDKKNFLLMRKHLRAMATGFHGAKELRISFESINCAADVSLAVDSFRQSSFIRS